MCMREETFAPMAPISSFETEEEAISRANNTAYGLSAYAMTRDIGRIFRLSRAALRREPSASTMARQQPANARSAE